MNAHTRPRPSPARVGVGSMAAAALLATGLATFVTAPPSQATVPGPVAQGHVIDGPGTATWPGGVVPYEFDDALPPELRPVFEDAFADFEAKTPVRWVPRTDETSYVDITGSGDGCSAHLGAPADPGVVTLTVADCPTGLIKHELGHILGLEHELSRADRDEYLTIDRDALVDDTESDSLRDGRLGDEAPGLTVGNYDYVSMMQYPNEPTPSTDEQSWFYESTTYFPTEEIGSNDDISEGDRDALFRLYGDPAAQPRVTGQIDTTSTALTSLTLTGSAIDPASPGGPVTISTLIDGEVVDSAPASGTPEFTVTTPVPDGRHTVCLRGTPDPAAGIRHTTLGCTVVTMGGTIGDLETVERTPEGLRVQGWMINTGAPEEPVRVPVHLDSAEATITVADIERPDIAARYPDAGARHGFDVTIPAEPGPRDVCVFKSESDAAIEIERPDPLECLDTDTPPVVDPPVTDPPVTDPPVVDPPVTGNGTILAPGDVGDDVLDWQHNLNTAGSGTAAPLDADGVFGATTETATRAFQDTWGLPTDGTVTQDDLRVVANLIVFEGVPDSPRVPVDSPVRLTTGSTGPGVSAWQADLMTVRPTVITLDGNFAADTREATIAFQRDNDLDADGIVGPGTRHAMADAVTAAYEAE